MMIDIGITSAASSSRSIGLTHVSETTADNDNYKITSALISGHSYMAIKTPMHITSHDNLYQQDQKDHHQCHNHAPDIDTWHLLVGQTPGKKISKHRRL